MQRGWWTEKVNETSERESTETDTKDTSTHLTYLRVGQSKVCHKLSFTEREKKKTSLVKAGIKIWYHSHTAVVTCQHIQWAFPQDQPSLYLLLNLQPQRQPSACIFCHHGPSVSMQISLKGRGQCDDDAKMQLFADHLLWAVKQVKQQPEKIRLLRVHENDWLFTLGSKPMTNSMRECVQNTKLKETPLCRYCQTQRNIEEHGTQQQNEK